MPWLAFSLTALADALTGRAGAGYLRAAADALGRARATAAHLRMSRLLGLLAAPTDEWSFAREAAGWLLLAGEEHARLPDGKGPHPLRALLRAPRSDITALDLAAGGSELRAPSTVPCSIRPPSPLSRQTWCADGRPRRRDRTGNASASRRLEAERARQASAEAGRGRVNVTRTLRATLDRIAATAPRTAAHLQASIRTGLSCRHDPTGGGLSRWQV